MTVEQEDVIDYIGIDDAEDDVCLSIIDTLDWDNSTEHIILLENKINTYMRFIESGEIFEVYPNAQSKTINIDLYIEHELNDHAQTFIKYVSETLDESGFNLRVKMI